MAIYSGLLVLLLGIISCHAAEQFASCQDGARAKGICVTLKSCQPISALLMRGGLTDNERNYLKNSDCGTTPEKARLVCCPLPRMLKARFSAPSSLPTAGNCGLDLGSRIVGGEIAPRGEYPWLARIQYYKSNKRFGFHCGGVLINDRYVLTAAHCIQSVPSSWTVYKIRFGEYDSTEDNDCNFYDERDCGNETRDILVASYYIHEDYFQENGADYNDIALIRLVEPVQFTSYIQPICLPITDDLKKLDTAGVKMTVAGWGQTENKTASRYLMHLKVPSWDNEQCRDAFSPVNVDIIETQLCAGGEKNQDSCRGDSGGPLMKVEKIGGKSSWFLKGVVSFGTEKCGTEDVPGVYTRVSKFVDWIQENIEE